MGFRNGFVWQQFPPTFQSHVVSCSHCILQSINLTFYRIRVMFFLPQALQILRLKRKHTWISCICVCVWVVVKVYAIPVSVAISRHGIFEVACSSTAAWVGCVASILTMPVHVLFYMYIVYRWCLWICNGLLCAALFILCCWEMCWVELSLLHLYMFMCNYQHWVSMYIRCICVCTCTCIYLVQLCQVFLGISFLCVHMCMQCTYTCT